MCTPISIYSSTGKLLGVVRNGLGSVTATPGGTLVSTYSSNGNIYTQPLTYLRTVKNDFSASGVSCILFRNASNGDMGYYQLDASGAFAGWRGIVGSPTAYTVVGTGDFNGDGVTDVLMRNNTIGGDTGFYQMNSDGSLQGWHTIGSSSTDYSVVGAGDFNGDGITDVLFRNNALGGDTGFYQVSSDGSGALQGWRSVGSSNTDYSVVGAADFNGDSVTDILFRNNDDRRYRLLPAQQRRLVPGLAWRRVVEHGLCPRRHGRFQRRRNAGHPVPQQRHWRYRLLPTRKRWFVARLARDRWVVIRL